MSLDFDAYWFSFMQLEETKMEGVVWRLYRDKQGGLVRGNDGIEIPFRRAALSGMDFQALFAGQRVCYRVQTGWWGPEAEESNPWSCQVDPPRTEVKRMNRTELLKISMGTPDGPVVVRRGQAIVDLQGIFIRDVRLPVGPCVFIRVARRKNEVSLKGIACADRGGSGVAVRWEGMSDETSCRLASILAVAA